MIITSILDNFTTIPASRTNYTIAKASRILNDTTGLKHHSENPAIAVSVFPLQSDSTPVQSDRQTSQTPEVA